VDWEEVAYTVIFLTVIIMMDAAIIPLALTVQGYGNLLDAAPLSLFFYVEWAGIVTLTFARALIKVKKALRAEGMEGRG